MSAPNLKVVEIYPTNFRDVPGALRSVADDVENGVYGDVSCVAISMMGKKIEVFGIGPESEAPMTACLLEIGAKKLRDIMFAEEDDD